MANGKRTHVVAVSLPKELFRELEKLRGRFYRKRSEMVKDAIREYIQRHRATEAGRSAIGGVEEERMPYDAEKPTAAEQAAIIRGEAEYRRGEFLTLEEFRARLRRQAKRDVARRRR